MILSVYSDGKHRMMITKGHHGFKIGEFSDGFFVGVPPGIGFSKLEKAQKSLDDRADDKGWKWIGKQEEAEIYRYRTKGKNVIYN